MISEVLMPDSRFAVYYRQNNLFGWGSPSFASTLREGWLIVSECRQQLRAVQIEMWEVEAKMCPIDWAELERGSGARSWSFSEMVTLQRNYRILSLGEPNWKDCFPMSQPLATYRRYLEQLHAMIREGKGDSDEADLLREEMEEPWYLLSEEEKQEMAQYSEDLYAKEAP